MKKMSKTFINNAITYALVIVAFIVMTILQNAGVLTRSMKGQLVPICVYIVMAVSLNLVVGISGELCLGHAGFMSVGAFTGVVAAACLAGGVPNPTLRLILAMIVGGIMAAVAGVIIGVPVLRLRGDYLAIVTLAFGEIIRNVINCLYVALDGSALRMSFNTPVVQDAARTAEGIPFQVLINGPQGATVSTKLASFTMGFVLIIFSLIVVLNLIISVSGALSAFEMPYVVTKGALGTSTFFVVMDKLAHTDQKVGLASAMAVVLLVLIMLVTAVQKFVQKKMEEAESRPVPLTVTTEQNYAAKATSATPAGK